jgi:uncharacterized protein YaaQ
MLHGGRKPEIQHMIMAVVHSRDLDSATQAMSNAGLSVTQIQAHGRVMQRKSHLLMIGLSEGKLQLAVRTLLSATRKRAKFVASPIDGLEAQAEPVQVDGATVFVLSVERAEIL